MGNGWHAAGLAEVRDSVSALARETTALLDAMNFNIFYDNRERNRRTHLPGWMQRLLRSAGWDTHEVRDGMRDYVIETSGERRGVLIADETGFLKKGT